MYLYLYVYPLIYLYIVSYKYKNIADAQLIEYQPCSALKICLTYRIS